jgi:hypothetical protein
MRKRESTEINEGPFMSDPILRSFIAAKDREKKKDAGAPKIREIQRKLT